MSERPRTGHSGEPRADVVIIGSGFGGAMVAHDLVHAGLDVVMLERGDWVPRGPHNWAPDASVDLTPYYSFETPYRVVAGGAAGVMGAYTCVGGPSVFYGGVALRFREADFASEPGIVGASGARWPFDYGELEPYYGRAEQILDVAGEVGVDPTEPFRRVPYPQAPGPLAHVSRVVAGAARSLGLRPFRLPLAINYRDGAGRTACVACNTCDTFACAVGAKNDLATTVIPDLVTRGMRLEANTVATRIVQARGRVVEVEAVERITGAARRFRADTFVVSAGSLASPHLLLASGLDESNPAGHLVGSHLMRHANAIVFGAFTHVPDSRHEFHKQLGIHDFYFGDPALAVPRGKLGSIQQLATPPVGLVRHELPAALGPFVGIAVEHLTGMLVMAEDQPRAANRLSVDWSTRDEHGLPQPVIEHHYTPRDEAARDALLKRAKSVLRRAGARAHYVHRIKTFSHAVGTVRCGDDPATAPLDAWCGYRGTPNLYVVDGSFMPTSAGLNPSLTISANALRVASHLLGRA